MPHMTLLYLLCLLPLSPWACPCSTYGVVYIDEGQPVDYFHSPDVLAPAGLEEGMTSSVYIVDPHGTSMEETQYDLATHDGPSSLDTGTLVSRSTASTFDEPNQPSIKAELNGIIIGYSHLIMHVPQLT